MCKLGALDHQIADELGITPRTFYSWKAKHGEFAAAIKRGKDVADDIVEDSLFRNATGFEYEEEEVKVVGTGSYAVMEKTTVRKTKHPDTSVPYTRSVGSIKRPTAASHSAPTSDPTGHREALPPSAC